MKPLEKKIDVNYIRMLWVVLNKSREQRSIKQQLYDHLPTISQTIQDEQNMYVTAGKIRTNSKPMLSFGHLRIDTLVLNDQQ